MELVCFLFSELATMLSFLYRLTAVVKNVFLHS